MFTLTTMRQNAGKCLGALTAAAALGGGIYSAQAADSGSGADKVVRAAEAKPGTSGDVAAAAEPGHRFRTVPGPETTRAAQPQAGPGGGEVVAADSPRTDERPAPAPSR